MSVVEPGPSVDPAGILGRIQRLLAAPSAEWSRIESEPASVQSLMVGWVVPLAAIPVLATVVGQQVFGAGIPGIATYKPGLVVAVITGALQYAALVGMTFVMALVIDGLAGNFGAQRSRVQAMKTAAYSGAAMFVFGVVNVIPMLGFIGLAGLVWSIFLLNGGLVQVMKAPAEKAFGYTAAVVGVMFLAWCGVAVVLGGASGVLGMSTVAGVLSGAADDDQVRIGGSNVDLSELEEAGKELEAAGREIEAQMSGDASTVPPMDTSALEGLLPASLPGGFTQTEVSTGTSGAFGLGVGGATGTYTNGDKEIKLMVGDMGRMGAIAGLAGAFGAQSSTRNADGFERIGTVDGRTTFEKVSIPNKTAEYAVIVSKRYLLSVEGKNISLEEAKRAADVIGVAKLEAMAQ